MNAALDEASQRTPARLTALLRSAGALPAGEVTSVRHSSRSSNTAQIIQLELDYTPEAAPAAPRQLWLKNGVRQAEAFFYRQLAPTMASQHILRCYDADEGAERRPGYVLLQDVSVTHAEPLEALPLTGQQATLLVDALARVHAYWWEHPRLREDVGAFVERDNVQGYVAQLVRQSFADFVGALGDRLPAARRQVYEAFLAAWPPVELKQRQARRQAVTLVHGDAHGWNALFPRQQDAAPLYLLDWSVWHIAPGTNDLAYMMAQHWYPVHRAQLEQPLLRHYHRRLLEHGVSAYTWEQCWLDYRRSVVSALVWPIFHWAVQASPDIWWHNLERLLLAFDDLACAELLPY